MSEIRIINPLVFSFIEEEDENFYPLNFKEEVGEEEEEILLTPEKIPKIIINNVKKVSEKKMFLTPQKFRVENKKEKKNSGTERVKKQMEKENKILREILGLFKRRLKIKDNVIKKLKIRINELSKVDVFLDSHKCTN